MRTVLALLALVALVLAALWWFGGNAEHESSPPAKSPTTPLTASAPTSTHTVERPASPESATVPSEIPERIERVEVARSGKGLSVKLEFDCAPDTDLALRLLDANRRVLAETTTRSGATWPLPPAGRYSLVCEAPEWREFEQDLEVPVEGGPLTVTLHPVAWNGIAGRVTEQGTGAPVERYTLWLDTRSPGSGGAMEVEMVNSRAVADANGAFCFAGFRTSGKELRLRVRAGDHGRAESDWLPFDSTSWLNDVHLETLRDAAIDGRVVDADRRTPIADALVRRVAEDASLADAWNFDGQMQLAVDQAFEAWTSGAEEPERWTTTSRADGTFALETTSPGTARLLVVAAGYPPTLTDVLSLNSGARVGPLTIALARGASVLGRLDTPTPEALRVPRSATLIGPSGQETRPIAADGTFRFDGLADGVYQIAVNEDAGNGRQPLVATRTVTIREHRDEELTIPLGVGLTGCRLDGELLLPADSGIAEWRVFALRAEGTHEPEASAEVTATGHFELTDLAPGRTLVIAAGADAAQARVALGAGAVELVDGGRATLRIDLSSIAVHLKYAGSALGADGVRIELVAANTTPADVAELLDKVFSPRTDAAGVLELYGLPPGDYELSASGVESQRFTVRPDAAQRFDIVLR